MISKTLFLLSFASLALANYDYSPYSSIESTSSSLIKSSSITTTSTMTTETTTQNYNYNNNNNNNNGYNYQPTSTTTTTTTTTTSTTQAYVQPTNAYSPCNGQQDGYLRGVGCCVSNQLVSNWDQCHQQLFCKPRYESDEHGHYHQNDHGKFWQGDDKNTWIQKSECPNDLYEIDEHQKYTHNEKGHFWRDHAGNYWNIHIQVEYLLNVTAPVPDNSTGFSHVYGGFQPGTSSQEYLLTGKANFAKSVGVSMVLIVVLGTIMML